jgi:hypothetical protein
MSPDKPTPDKPKAEQPKAPEIQLGEPGEHPLSVLIFSWMRTPLFFRFFMGVLAGFGALLVALDIVLLRRSFSSLESLPGFFGIFGFLAFGIAVLSGWPLGHVMRRHEDYYDTSSGEAGDDH